jgi:hypothetical protein
VLDLSGKIWHTIGMATRVETVAELKQLYKQALIPVPPHPGTPEGQAAQAQAQGPPPGAPPGPPPGAPPGPPPGDPAAQGPPPGAPPQGDPNSQSGSVPPELASIIDQVVNVASDTKNRVAQLEAKFEQDKALRDKDREHGEKRRQLIETILPAASV